MTLILANELHGSNITVNAGAPSPTATALFLDGGRGKPPVRRGGPCTGALALAAPVPHAADGK
ncbi:hypothetical protein [Acidovorax sp.]|uniref:hypothetical protein n=1 Tax=Acidovorax sp. TaxID=1872122 RepID=UPI002ACEF3C0|nr:hypothetical protein [Acidovorax sp.]MDZ7861451.1 hypothetical protein [Acidovorax sp.]